MKKLGLEQTIAEDIINYFVNFYSKIYPSVTEVDIVSVFNAEEQKFSTTLSEGKKEFEKGTDPFILATTYGFPIELTQELAKENGQDIDLEDFKNKMAEHQKLSQTASAGMFKGGLADTSEATIRLHTAHHLLLAALREVLGDHVHQRGSNITPERLRIDFLHPQKVTLEELAKVEGLVNGWIKAKLPMTRVEIKREEAEKVGAQMEFGAKYPDIVSVYFVGDNLENAISKEFCGGPHVSNTAELDSRSRDDSRDSGPFKILKEEAVAQGIRRIKAVLV
jgi:alanyl-tRNA synthetase